MTAVVPERTRPEPPSQVAAEPHPLDPGADDLVVADMLVEEISIDGMCGVY